MKRPFLKRPCFLMLIALLLGAEFAQAAGTVTFTVQTQNVLRFGHGRRLDAQCQALEAAANAADIIVLQEVMTNGYPCLAQNNSKGVNRAVPAGYSYIGSGPKGRSSYIEYYGILYPTAAVNGRQFDVVDTRDLSHQTPFMRPPFGALFRITDSSNPSNVQTCQVWVVDLHSVFGKTIDGRRAEAAAMKTVYGTLRALNNDAVLIAGDWNLIGNDATGFGWLGGQGAAIDPSTVKTSLTPAGVPSSEYDHVVFTSQAGTPRVTLVPAGDAGTWTVPAANQLGAWRANVSDHMGVKARVTVTC